MQCDCIEKIERKIREATGDPEAKLNTMLELRETSTNIRVCVPYVFREKKKDGSFTKERDALLALEKCPFCGMPQSKPE